MKDELATIGAEAVAPDGISAVLGRLLEAQIMAIVSTGSIGAGVFIALMVATATWCLVKQVRYRYGRAVSPVAPSATALFVVASGVFVLIALHPESMLPACVGSMMIVIFVFFVGTIACWSLFANLSASRIRRRYDERSESDHTAA